MEVETYILLAQELNYVETDQSESLLARTAEVGKILNGLLNSLGRVTNH
jgi:four helix bundle protein